VGPCARVTRTYQGAEPVTQQARALVAADCRRRNAGAVRQLADREALGSHPRMRSRVAIGTGAVTELGSDEAARAALLGTAERDVAPRGDPRAERVRQVEGREARQDARQPLVHLFM